MTTDVNNLVFVGLNSRVAALNQDTGTLVWQWRATTPRNGGYVSLLLLDEARLIVSVNGYTYCLDPKTGELSQGVADPSTVQARVCGRRPPAVARRRTCLRRRNPGGVDAWLAYESIAPAAFERASPDAPCRK